MSSSSYRLAIARTILGQLGGNRFVAMTGARQFVALEAPGLQFDLPEDGGFACGGICRIKVRLDPCDTYTVTAFARKGNGPVYCEVSSRPGVYCDMLEGVFTEITGLYTRL
ncbi:hypothetical protein [Photobacterium sp. TY1-4]|uniref:hypothetical protein n=1 Tax=Photobacterium sp. TY1-4 TaxID=2899122 RepID=UPI0021C0189B|nr:hypothetical protein [Photobacterium sp. TY1-4]UXI04734.1 hypothetical protein NH461_25625 [Photobacterium sp. TY1-4]